MAGARLFRPSARRIFGNVPVLPCKYFSRQCLLARDCIAMITNWDESDWIIYVYHSCTGYIGVNGNFDIS